MSAKKSDNSIIPDPYSGKEAFGLFSNNKLEVYSLFALAILGIFFRMFVNQKNDMTGDKGPATNTLWGYGLSSVCILCIIFIMYGISKRELMDSKNFDPNIKNGFFSNIMYILGEGNIFLMVLIVIILIFVLNYVYYQKINVGIIPESFTRFNYVSNLLMVIQFMILFQYINIRMFSSEGKNLITGVITATTYFLSTINIIFIIIMYILIKYYSTDG